MARQRTTFGKIMREREKQQRAQAKQEKRAERAADDGENGVEDAAPTHDESDVLASLAKLHEAFDNEQIDFDTFEERRAELMSRLKID
jgi:hypothetical protein